MPSIHYLPTGLRRTLPDGTSEELCFVLVVDEDMHMTITTRPYKLLPITGGSQVPTRSIRFPPNEDLVSSPMGMAILTGKLEGQAGGRFANSEEKEEEGKEMKEEEEFGIPWRRCFERADRGQLEVVEQGEQAFDAEGNPLMNDYPEEYVEECPRG
ncbi:hypothetical protein B9Z19DRAFT_1073382 [Tuber borchii]|uniref:Uncharacterized protein n=1 Tax=Tuber borchii TaxID=42251 RepID=A0A2T7A5Y6_TUBBO|nr:hypothetical protein B9Z19DRAFT_1073382 [Tuber borchii]